MLVELNVRYYIDTSKTLRYIIDLAGVKVEYLTVKVNMSN